jgi:hypothetical protein
MWLRKGDLLELEGVLASDSCSDRLHIAFAVLARFLEPASVTML